MQNLRLKSRHQDNLIESKTKKSQNLIFKQFNFEEWNLKNQLKKLKKMQYPILNQPKV
jgi:hypothetical protein